MIAKPRAFFPTTQVGLDAAGKTTILRKLGCHSRTQAAVLVRSLEPDAVSGDGPDV